MNLKKVTVFAAPLLVAAALMPGFGKPSFPTGNDLLGTWKGSSKGYQGDLYKTGEAVKIIITEAKGKAFKGYVIHSRLGEPARRETVNGFIAATGDVFATDSNGFYDMKLYENGSLGIVYRENSPKQVASTMFGLYNLK
ncbi:MAG: hypothetical protein AB8B70_07380 [Prochlorococcus sp.]